MNEHYFYFSNGFTSSGTMIASMMTNTKTAVNKSHSQNAKLIHGGTPMAIHANPVHPHGGLTMAIYNALAAKPTTGAHKIIMLVLNKRMLNCFAPFALSLMIGQP